MKLSVIVPVFNERQTIPIILIKVLEAPLPSGLEREIIVIDDGSTDGTKDELKKFQNHPLITIYLEDQNRGKTHAVKKGISHATGELILIQDADLEYDPKHYPELISPILKGSCDAVYGSRFLGKIQDMAFVNRFANRISAMTINALFQSSLTDFHTCFKVFKREIFDHIKITTKNFSFDTEITAKLLRHGYRILEVPIEYVARKKHEGKKITWWLALETYFFLIKYRFFPTKHK